MNRQIEELARRAGQLAGAGRLAEAEQAWRQVLAADPAHPQALASLGFHALQHGELAEARAKLEAARRQAPADILVRMALANLYRQLAEPVAERDAIEEALAIDAYYVPALLARGQWQERSGDGLAAALTYRNVLRIVPAEPAWPPAFREQLRHAREVVTGYRARLHAYLEAQTAALRAELPGAVGARWTEAISVAAELTRPYLQDCNQLHVPRLPPLTFYERGHFPWIPALEACFAEVREELLGLLAEEEGFVPYIAYGPGEPVNQWASLNHSPTWSAFHLWRGGRPVEENLRRCPRTARALETVPRVDIEGLCPNAMFSVLAPGTAIPPHHGETNARLIAHLPLVVPPGCRFRVGFDEREWREGEVLVFDDTLEHAARNDSALPRVVMIFDVWNPLLADEERVMVQAMARALREFPG